LIATQHFVFVHMPKTGGEFVRAIIERHFEVVWRSEEYHAPSFALAGHLLDRPRFAVVRDPWDWHVSMWAYMRIGDGPSPMRARAKKGFRPFIKGMRHRYVRRFGRMTEGCEILRFEHLRDELASFMSEYVPEERRQALLEDLHEAPRVNTTDHRPYASYYDEELAALVESNCVPIIERFGYENPLASAELASQD
jgi:hypothetical protein